MEERELINKIVELRDSKKMKYKEIGARLGIKERQAWKLYHKFHATKKDEVPMSLIDVVTPWAEGVEQVTVVVYNPEDKGNKLNQLTITTEIKSGLTGDLREMAIGAAIQQNELIEWTEI